MKRIISLLLAAVLSTGMAVAAFAADNPKITEQLSALDDVDAGECEPGQEIWIPLVKKAFDGAVEDLTAADVKASKITVKQTARSGSKAIGSVEIKENSKKVACVLLTLADAYTSTKPLDFETRVELYINGKRQNLQTTVTGTLSNSFDEVYADTEYIDLSSGSTAKCVESAKKVEAYLGNGVSIFVNMTKGKEYYGTVSIEPSDDDVDLMDKYPDITDVLSLATIGMNADGKTVKLDVDDEYYVYSKNLKYLGRGDEMLPYSTKYYLATRKLDVDDDVYYEAENDQDEPEDEPEDEPGETADPDDEDEPEDEGNRQPAKPQKPNNNPDTGLPFMSKASVMGIILSLGAMASLKAKRE